MSVSSRTRERAAEVVRVTSDMPTEQRIRIMTAILSIPDYPEEVAIRAAAMEEAAANVEQDAAKWRELAQQCADHNGPAKPWSQFAVQLYAAARRIRALAPAPSGWAGVRVEDLRHVRLCDDYLDENCPPCERIASAALPEDPTDG